MKSSSDEKRIDISMVLPVYKEAVALKKFVPELMEELEKLGMSYEVIFVNMHVPNADESYELLKKYADQYDNFYPIDMKYLRTNLHNQKGEQYRIGFELARGKYVITMDTDYQDSPADLSKFIKKLEDGYDLVVGWKQNRKDPFFYKLTSKGQNFLTRLLSGLDIHDKNCGFKAYSRPAVESLRLYGLNFRDIAIQLKVREFKITEVPIENRLRPTDTNRFNFMSRLMGGTFDLMSDLIMSKLEDTPFRFWGITAVITFAAALAPFLVYIVENVWGILGMTWLLDVLLILTGVMTLTSVMFVLTGFIMQYLVDQRNFNTDYYHIYGDYKDITKRLN
jgi:glycosyltransferase involved in cell wall biosynthesis